MNRLRTSARQLQLKKTARTPSQWLQTCWTLNRAVTQLAMSSRPARDCLREWLELIRDLPLMMLAIPHHILRIMWQTRPIARQMRVRLWPVMTVIIKEFFTAYVMLFFLNFWCIVSCLFCVVSTCASDCLEKLVSKMTCYVSSRKLYSLPHGVVLA